MKFAFVITDDLFELDDFVKSNIGSFELKFIKDNEIAYWNEKEERSLVSLEKKNKLYDLMEPEAKAYLNQQFDSFNIFFVRFFNFEVAKCIICSAPIERKLLIDNDYGGILERNVFCQMDTYAKFISITEIPYS